MATQIPPTISPVPTPAIQRNDRTTFSNRVDAFVTWLITGVAQFGAVATNVYNNAVDAAASASSALSNKGLSQAAADAAESYRTQAKNSADAAAASALTIGTTAAFSDANPMVKNATVNTKQGRFKANLIAPATIRDYELPNKNGIMALTSDTGLAMVAGPVTPTASAFVDLLNIFTSGASGFDNYTIVLNGVAASSATGSTALCMRVAVAGVADSSNSYATAIFGATGSTNSSSATVGWSALTAATAGNIEIKICNTSSTSAIKTGFAISVQRIGNTTDGTQRFFWYDVPANALSGFRLFWSDGSNFLAQGSIRVYGSKNA